MVVTDSEPTGNWAQIHIASQLIYLYWNMGFVSEMIGNNLRILNRRGAMPYLHARWELWLQHGGCSEQCGDWRYGDQLGEDKGLK